MPDYGDDKGFGSGSLGGNGREDGGDTKDFGKSVGPTPDKFGTGMSPGQASAIFGNQLGPLLAGFKEDKFYGQTNLSVADADQLARRMNVGQFANSTSINILGVEIPSVVGMLLNEGAKFGAKQLVTAMATNPDAQVVRDKYGSIVGVRTDKRGLIYGSDPNRTGPDRDGDAPSQGTFTSKSVGSTSNTSVTSASTSIPVSKTGSGVSGNPDSSGSGRRSLLGKVYNG